MPFTDWGWCSALASAAALVAATARAQGTSIDVSAFASIRDLLQQVPAASLRLALVAGYAAAGDGGGGMFVWSAAETAEPDEGLTFTLPVIFQVKTKN